MQNKVLQVVNVTKNFTVKNKVISAVKELSFDLMENEWVAIVGGSGSGKSTLAELIANMQDVTSGAIYWREQLVKQLSFKTYYKDVQMIFQNPLQSISPRMKIIDFLSEPYRNFYHLSKAEARHYIKQDLEKLLLPERILNCYPHELSGGQLQRIVIARAMAVKPKLLICDESTSALDMMVQQEVVQVLKSLHAENKFAMLFITHDLTLALTLCEKIYVMHAGEIVDSIEKGKTVNICHPYTQKLLMACEAMTLES